MSNPAGAGLGLSPDNDGRHSKPPDPYSNSLTTIAQGDAIGINERAQMDVVNESFDHCFLDAASSPAPHQLAS